MLSNYLKKKLIDEIWMFFLKAESTVSIRVSRDRSPLEAQPLFDQSYYVIHIRENEEPKNLINLRVSLINSFMLFFTHFLCNSKEDYLIDWIDLVH